MGFPIEFFSLMENKLFTWNGWSQIVPYHGDSNRSRAMKQYVRKNSTEQIFAKKGDSWSMNETSFPNRVAALR